MNTYRFAPTTVARQLLNFAPQLLRRGGWQRNVLALLDQAVVSAASFGTAMLLGRFGSREELGVYALALTLLMLLVNVQGELITAPYNLFRQRRTATELPHYTGSMLVHELAYIGAALLVLAVCALALSGGWGPASLLPTVVVLLVAAPFWLLRAFVRYISFANLQFATALVVDAVTAVIQLALLLLLLWSDQLRASTTYAVMGLASAIACGGWLWARQLSMQLSSRRAWQDFQSNWSFARWTLTSQLIGCITPYLLPWILAHACGAADTGTFAACTNLCGIASMFVVGLALALTPQAARAFATGGATALLQILARTAILFGVGVGTFCLAILVTGDLAMTTIYGPSFGGTHLTISLLAFSVLSNSFSVVFGNGLCAMNRPAANLLADATVLLATLVCAFILIPQFGITGAAAATLIGSALGALVRGLVFRQVLRHICCPALAT